ncbi:hypothetical protein PIB30_049988 [Stylosanthes scabra]|uniref:F-box domain-containing protein n=1 Tax=Stylosanthes scabra TaxID=79078 RepID=A0ABU6RHM9_9FABA|nr:hypothetical protein [Stylosanthes scabra]
MADIEMLEAPAQWNLPDDLIVEILCRSDPATVGRSRALSSKWNQILTNFEFLQKSYKINLKRQHSLLMHVFFPNWTDNRNSMIRVDSKTEFLRWTTLLHCLQLSTETWSEFVGLEGNLSRLSSEYVSINGEVSWINYGGDTYQSPDSVITYSVLSEGWRRLIIPEKCKAGAHRLLNFKGKVSLASYPIAKDQYALVV